MTFALAARYCRRWKGCTARFSKQSKTYWIAAQRAVVSQSVCCSVWDVTRAICKCPVSTVEAWIMCLQLGFLWVFFDWVRSSYYCSAFPKWSHHLGTKTELLYQTSSSCCYMYNSTTPYVKVCSFILVGNLYLKKKICYPRSSLSVRSPQYWYFVPCMNCMIFCIACV